MTHAQNATSEPSFHLVVLAGPDELARGFLQGLYLGAGHDGFLDFACGEAAEHVGEVVVPDIRDRGQHREIEREERPERPQAAMRQREEQWLVVSFQWSVKDRNTGKACAACGSNSS